MKIITYLFIVVLSTVQVLAQTKKQNSSNKSNEQRIKELENQVNKLKSTPKFQQAVFNLTSIGCDSYTHSKDNCERFKVLNISATTGEGKNIQIKILFDALRFQYNYEYDGSWASNIYFTKEQEQHGVTMRDIINICASTKIKTFEFVGGSYLGYQVINTSGEDIDKRYYKSN